MRITIKKKKTGAATIAIRAETEADKKALTKLVLSGLQPLNAKEPKTK